MRAIIRDSSGHLILRFKVLGQHFSEQTQYVDTYKNRKHLSALHKRIREDINNGVFEYREHFPHSKNVNIISAIRAKFISPDWRALPTVRHFLVHEYQGIVSHPLPKMMLHIMSCIGEVRVNEVTGLHIVTLADSLKAMVGISKSQLFLTMSFVLDILDKAALSYKFERPFRLMDVTKLEDPVKPLSLQDISYIARFIPVKYYDLFMCQFHLGIPSWEIVELEWSQYNSRKSSFSFADRVIHVAPYSRKFLFHLLKKTGNSRYVFCDDEGQKLKLNHSWINNYCWVNADKEAGTKRERINGLRHASIPYLFESGLSVSQISQQTQTLYRPTINRILSEYILM